MLKTRTKNQIGGYTFAMQNRTAMKFNQEENNHLCLPNSSYDNIQFVLNDSKIFPHLKGRTENISSNKVNGTFNIQDAKAKRT
uniref:Putative ovule protein n=1 Tax=Solanum chacoense TaxID=4108 RepID=A0A0V0GKC4_SOLCH